MASFQQPSSSSSKSDLEATPNKEREDSTATSPDDAAKPPPPSHSDLDGTGRAWLMVFGAFLALANTMGLQSTFGAFQSFYERDLLASHSSSTIAWIGTLQLALSAGSGIVTGPLFDRGKDKYIFMAATVLVVLSYMLLSISRVYWQVFLTQGVLGGLSGIVFTPALGLATVNFTKRKALATGVATSGFAFGAVVYPIVFRRLQPRIGFPWTCRVLGFIALGCLIVAYPLLYFRTNRKATKARRIFDLSAWKEAPYAIYCCAVWFMYAGYWPAYIFITSFASRALGTSLNEAYYIFAIMNAANTLARWTATFVADHLGIIETFVVADAITTIIAFSWAAVDSRAGVIVWAIFYGFASGTLSAVFAAVIPSLSPGPSVIGTRIGMMNGLVSTAMLTSAPIAGAILDMSSSSEGSGTGAGRFLGLQMWPAACFAVSTLLALYPLWHLRRVRKNSC